MADVEGLAWTSVSSPIALPQRFTSSTRVEIGQGGPHAAGIFVCEFVAVCRKSGWSNADEASRERANASSAATYTRNNDLFTQYVGRLSGSL